MEREKLDAIINGVSCLTSHVKNYLIKVGDRIKDKTYSNTEPFVVYMAAKVSADIILLVLRDGGKYVLNYTAFLNAFRGIYIDRAQAPVYIVARHNGKILGVSGLMFEKRTASTIVASGFIVTAREARCKGIAKAVTVRAIDFAHERGAVYLANVDETNAASRKTVECIGMRFTGLHKNGRHVIREYTI